MVTWPFDESLLCLATLASLHLESKEFKIESQEPEPGTPRDNKCQRLGTDRWSEQGLNPPPEAICG
jgi:hypothetical protein